MTRAHLVPVAEADSPAKERIHSAAGDYYIRKLKTFVHTAVVKLRC
jgi:hypothetical protein